MSTAGATKEVKDITLDLYNDAVRKTHRISTTKYPSAYKRYNS